jgi:hydrogenase maturation factor
LFSAERIAVTESNMYQQIFNIVIVVAGFLAAYVLSGITQRIQKLEDKIDSLPETYVRKDDYREDVREIKAMLHQIFDRLDAKADKNST